MEKESKDLFCKVVEIEEQAKQYGFYWQHIEELIAQIRNECNEIHEAHQKNDRRHLQEEIGDVMLASISLAIFCDVDPYDTLKSSIEKFQKRYDKVIQIAKRAGYTNLRNQPMDVLLDFWAKAKQEVKE